MNNLPPSFEYERMVDLNEDYRNISYQEFITMNKRHYALLDVDEKLFIDTLNKRVNRFQVATCDTEHCVEFSADFVYFNPSGKLCIASAR